VDQRQEEAFGLFANNVMTDYKKHNLIRINPKSVTPESGE